MKYFLKLEMCPYDTGDPTFKFGHKIINFRTDKAKSKCPLFVLGHKYAVNILIICLATTFISGIIIFCSGTLY